MASIIEQLYHGRVRPFERDTPLPSEHKAVALEARDAIKALRDSLTPEQKSLMEKAQNTQDLLSGFELREMYGKGVCFGTRLIMEAWARSEQEPGDSNSGKECEWAKRSLIEQIFTGDYYPEEDVVPDSKEFKRAQDIFGKRLDELYDTLNQHQRDLLEQVENAHTNVFGLTNRCFYTEGMRFGIRLMMELFPSPESDWISAQTRKEK